VDAPIDHHDITLRLHTRFPTGTPIDVRIVALPGIKDVVLEAAVAKNMTMLYAALGAPLFLFSALALRRRRAKRSQQ
jgi:hypothetical protein